MSEPFRRPAAFLPLCLSLCASACAQEPKAGGTPGLVERNSPLQVVEPDATDRDLRTTPVVRAVQRAADSVVSIYLQHQLANRGEAVTEGQGSGVILDDSGLVPRPSGRGVLPEVKGKTPEAGIAEYYVGFDAGGDVDRVWLLDAWPDASLARVLRPIAMGYRVDGAPGVDLSRKFAVLPIEFNDLRYSIRKSD